MTIAKQLAEFRLTRALTQKDLAAKLGVTINYLSLLENGQRSPSLAMLLRMGKVLKFSIVLVPK